MFFANHPIRFIAINQRFLMNVLDLAVLALGSSVVLFIFVMKSDLERTPIKIPVKKENKK